MIDATPGAAGSGSITIEDANGNKVILSNGKIRLDAPARMYLPASTLDKRITDLEGKRTPRKLTAADRQVVQFDWSPDGTALAFAHTSGPLADYWTTADLSVVDLVTGTGGTTFNGDQADATLATVYSPASLVVNGNYLYIADFNHARVRRVQINVSPRPIVTIAGTTTPGLASRKARMSAAEKRSWTSQRPFHVITLTPVCRAMIRASAPDWL